MTQDQLGEPKSLEASSANKQQRDLASVYSMQHEVLGYGAIDCEAPDVDDVCLENCTIH
jgi:hypothetical protein